MIDVPESAAVDFFRFERLHETLRFGIVVGVSRPAHADCNVVAGEALAVLDR
jgi:hypothetical protein